MHNLFLCLEGDSHFIFPRHEKQKLVTYFLAIVSKRKFFYRWQYIVTARNIVMFKLSYLPFQLKNEGNITPLDVT